MHLQSDRVDFIKLMLDANKMGMNSAPDTELEMKADEEDGEEENGEVTTTSNEKNGKQNSSRVLKQMTMKVRIGMHTWSTQSIYKSHVTVQKIAQRTPQIKVFYHQQ